MKLTGRCSWLFALRYQAPVAPLKNADVVFDVDEVDEEASRGSTQLRWLKVSQGGVEWIPKGASTAYRLKWRRFGELMVDNGRPRKAGKRRRLAFR